MLWLLIAATNQIALGQALPGNAISFNGINQGVLIPNFGNIAPTNEITVEFWANTRQAGSQSAFSMNLSSVTDRLNGHINFGGPPGVGVTYWDFGNINTSGRLGPAAPPANSIGNWVHYAFVATNNSMSIYTNGVLQTNKSGMTPFVRGNYTLQIGGPDYAYSGSIDDFRIWSVARSEAQIQANYNTPLVGNEANLLVYYKFDDIGTASNSATATGAAYNGILTNNPTWAVAFTNHSVVTNLADSGPGTLRQASSNAVPGTIISFDPSLSGHTIFLTSGPIQLATYLIIGASGITLDGNGTSSIFTVTNNAFVVLNSVTITNGHQNVLGGGGILISSGTLRINNSTFANNYGYTGGAIYNSGTLTLNCCTFYGNQTSNFGVGGGVYNSGTMTAINCTVVGNSLSGIYSDGALNLTNSIVCGNTGDATNDIPDNLYPPLGPSQPNNLVDVNAMLVPLGNYGGYTYTMPPLPNSPAIDAGNDSVTNTIVGDQRSLPRRFGAHVDIGAVELEALTLAASNLTRFAATLNGGVITNGLPISYYFAYGLTTNYTGYTATNSAATLFVSAPITNLTPSTTYHFQLVVNNSVGTTSGGDQTLNTLTPPSVSNFGSQVLSTNSVTGSITVQLSAYVNSYGLGVTVNFPYGLTTAYGGVGGPVNLPASTSASNMVVAVGGFVPGNTYHWYVVATNVAGTNVSADQTFTLPGGAGSGIPGDINGDGIVSQSEFDTVYGIYVTNSLWLYLTNVAGLGGTNVTFALSNSIVGSYYTVQYSTNLTDWQTLGPAVPRFLFTDTNAPANPKRYYRLVYP
jgi:hypothetical protein